ncbi:hypothetical protein TNCV_3604401 [Trichonephila clavipes]|nr:hypothetical protein TNCV_3604401 [Trichonephila clavipes]
MLYGYVACTRSFECLFGLGALGEIEFPRAVLYHQRSGAYLRGGNWASKWLVVIGIPPIWCCTKKRYHLPGNVLGLLSRILVPSLRNLQERATPTQRHDLTPKVSPIPIASPASVPPALFQLVSTQPSSGVNINACNKHYPPSYTAEAIFLNIQDKEFYTLDTLYPTSYLSSRKLWKETK